MLSPLPSCLQPPSRRHSAWIGFCAALLVAWIAVNGWAQSKDRQEAPLEQGQITEGPQQLNLWELLRSGGALMIPIYVISVLVVTLTFDRMLALRTNKVMPRRFLHALERLTVDPGGFDPQKAHRLTDQYPSAASHVMRAMLLKIGRPHAELERAVADASAREAARLYSRVRWLNLSAAVAPLLGLLGTVWGMIRAFYDTTQLHAGQNRADFLAQGIYIALVTTLGGLVVAIPAAISANYFEGRIEALMHRLDEMLLNFMPHVERFEGRRGVSPPAGSPPNAVGHHAPDGSAEPLVGSAIGTPPK